MSDIRLLAGKEVVQTNDIVTRRHETIAEVRAQESRTTRHQDSLQRIHTKTPICPEKALGQVTLTKHHKGTLVIRHELMAPRGSLPARPPLHAAQASGDQTYGPAVALPSCISLPALVQAAR